MNKPRQNGKDAEPRRWLLLGAACLFVLGAAGAVLLLSSGQKRKACSTVDVPLGVEQAVIVRYGRPRLESRPYRRGASVNLRIADEALCGEVRIYDIRYIVSLPGEFDLTDYLTSTDGQPIDDLPPFRVRGLSSLTKDIETRIQDIETVGVHIWHWYYEFLIGLVVLWVASLFGLIFLGRPKRASRPQPAPPTPSTFEQMNYLLDELAKRRLTVGEKAKLEVLLLKHWRTQLGLGRHPMASSCRRIEVDRRFGLVYAKLQAWLHNSKANLSPEEFLEAVTKNAVTATPSTGDLSDF